MPFSCCVAWSAFSAEKQMPRSLWPSSLRSLSLAVTTATRMPAVGHRRENRRRAQPLRIVHHHFGVRFDVEQVVAADAMHGGWSAGDDRQVVGLVKLGTTQSANSAVPSDSTRFRWGIWPPATACAM